MLTINVAVLLAVIVFLRLKWRPHARSRSEEQLTALIVLVLGILLAPTDLGQGILRVTKQLAESISEAAH